MTTTQTKIVWGGKLRLLLLAAAVLLLPGKALWAQPRARMYFSPVETLALAIDTKTQ